MKPKAKAKKASIRTTARKATAAPKAKAKPAAKPAKDFTSIVLGYASSIAAKVAGTKEWTCRKVRPADVRGSEPPVKKSYQPIRPACLYGASRGGATVPTSSEQQAACLALGAFIDKNRPAKGQNYAVALWDNPNGKCAVVFVADKKSAKDILNKGGGKLADEGEIYNLTPEAFKWASEKFDSDWTITQLVASTK